MLDAFLSTLRSLPSVPRSDLSRLATESTRAFDLIIDFLRNEAHLSHRALHALLTLYWHLIGSKAIPLLLDPFEGQLPSLHFFALLPPLSPRPLAFYALPYGFLDLVRADPVMQCCALVNMASQGCDYAAHRLDRAHTPERASAYEAEFLLALRPLLQREGLPWELNAYQQGVLHRFPFGLDSLSLSQRYFPPAAAPGSR